MLYFIAFIPATLVTLQTVQRSLILNAGQFQLRLENTLQQYIHVKVALFYATLQKVFCLTTVDLHYRRNPQLLRLSQCADDVSRRIAGAVHYNFQRNTNDLFAWIRIE